MQQALIHFEVFARKPGGGSFSLELATEDRTRAMETAKELLESRRAVAAKVVKETLDPETREFKSITIFSEGAAEKSRAKDKPEETGPLCVGPADLYTVHARERIGRLLETWLARNRVTPFEILHRGDLLEKLEATGVEIQHAIQKVSIPESQARGVTVHEIIRHFQQLTERAIERVIKDRRTGAFPDLEKESFAKVCARLMGNPERTYLLSGAVAGSLAPAKTWSEKVERLLDLADAAPDDPAARAFAFSVIEQPLGEIMGSRLGLADLLGDLDLGASLAALTRLCAMSAVEILVTADANVARQMPDFNATTARLAAWFEGPQFDSVRAAIGQRVLRELNSVRRLRPADAVGEIDIMRALAMILTAASGKLLPIEDVREAFIERSKMLVSSVFVDAYLKDAGSALNESRRLVWLVENVTGQVNKRQACRWLAAAVASLRFEKELRTSPESPVARLAALAELQRSLRRVAANEPEAGAPRDRIGELGGLIEADVRLISLIAKADTPFMHRVHLLAKIASGDSAPIGPATERAKAEAFRLLRSPEARAEFAGSPEAMEQIRVALQAAA